MSFKFNSLNLFNFNLSNDIIVLNEFMVMNAGMKFIWGDHGGGIQGLW